MVNISWIFHAIFVLPWLLIRRPVYICGNRFCEFLVLEQFSPSIERLLEKLYHGPNWKPTFRVLCLLPCVRWCSSNWPREPGLHWWYYQRHWTGPCYPDQLIHHGPPPLFLTYMGEWTDNGFVARFTDQRPNFVNKISPWFWQWLI